MNLIQQGFEQIKHSLLDFIVQSHSLIINSACQTIFFMFFTIELISWSLKKVNLFCATEISNSKIIKIITFILFSYLKIWNDWNFVLEIIGYFCSISISLQLYSGCIRIGKKFCRMNRHSFSNVSLLLSLFTIFLSYQIFNLYSNTKSRETGYTYIAVYFFTSIMIILLGVIRKKQVIYSIIIIFLTAFIIIARNYSKKILNETFLKSTNLPLESIFYLFFALHQSFEQSKQEYEEKALTRENYSYSKQNIWPSRFLIAQIYYFCFFLFNKRMFAIQLVFIFTCILSYLNKGRSQ